MSRIAFIIKKSTRPCINIKSSVIVKCYLYIGGWSGTQNPGFIYSSVYVVSIFFAVLNQYGWAIALLRQIVNSIS